MLYYKFCKLSDISQDDIEVTLKLLNSQQSDYINSLVESKRKQSIAVRTVLNLMLCECFKNSDVSLLKFDNNSKPILYGTNLSVSLTHSGEYVGCAVSEKPVGIDIEKIRSVKTTVINRVCSKAEVQFIKDYTDFFTLWTLKEAYIKASGEKRTILKNVSFVKNNELCFDIGNIITNEISGYKWSVIEMN